MMVMRNYYISIGSLITGLLFISGIGRDDIRLSKYYEFAKDSTFNCIGELYYKNEFQLSCILIDKKHILTAAHAFYHDSGSYHKDSMYEPAYKKWLYGEIPEKIVPGSADDFYVKFSGKKYKLKGFKIHDVYKNSKPYRDEYGIHPSEDYAFEVAVAELATEVKGIEPAILYEDKDELGKRAIMSGYGDVERADEYNAKRSKHKRRKMAGENMIDSFGGFKVGEEWGGLFFDFDAPNSNCCNRIGGSTPLPLEYFTSSGDCGSGLFLNKDGKWKLAGLCSSPEYFSELALYGDKYGKYYGFTCYYIRISLFKDWIIANTR